MSHILKSTDRTISDVKIADGLVLFIETDGAITIAAKIKAKPSYQPAAPKPQPVIAKGKPGRKPKSQKVAVVATAPTPPKVAVEHLNSEQHDSLT